MIGCWRAGRLQPQGIQSVLQQLVDDGAILLEAPERLQLCGLAEYGQWVDEKAGECLVSWVRQKPPFCLRPLYLSLR